MIRIGLVDDQPIMIQGLSMILSSVTEFTIVGDASNGVEALDMVRRNLPDILLMDIRMPKMNGVEATRLIKEEYPKTSIIILTTFNDDEYLFESLKGGASGYLLKDAEPAQIIEAIHIVSSGGTWINPDSATKMVERLKDQVHVQLERDASIDLLTTRELEICHYLGEGKNNKEIGDLLFISEGTVKNNMTRILDKLGLRDRTQLALFALKNKL